MYIWWCRDHVMSDIVIIGNAMSHVIIMSQSRHVWWYGHAMYMICQKFQSIKNQTSLSAYVQVYVGHIVFVRRCVVLCVRRIITTILLGSSNSLWEPVTIVSRFCHAGLSAIELCVALFTYLPPSSGELTLLMLTLLCKDWIMHIMPQDSNWGLEDILSLHDLYSTSIWHCTEHNFFKHTCSMCQLTRMNV